MMFFTLMVHSLLMLFISNGIGSIFIFTILSLNIINRASYDLFHSLHLVTFWQSLLPFSIFETWESHCQHIWVSFFFALFPLLV